MMHADHLCENKKCVNPEHLEFVTAAQNVLRNGSPSALNKVKTHCSQGHALSGENLYVHRNKRYCRACRKVTDKKFNEKRKK